LITPSQSGAAREMFKTGLTSPFELKGVDSIVKGHRLTA
jgi:hypothetical protein